MRYPELDGYYARHEPMSDVDRAMADLLAAVNAACVALQSASVLRDVNVIRTNTGGAIIFALSQESGDALAKFVEKTK